MERTLEGRTALVTGSTSGIGHGIALAYARAGARVMLNGFGRPEDIAAARREVGQAMGGGDAPYSDADLSKPEAVRDMVRAAERELGSLDILVNNAGITRDAMFHKMTPQQWKEVIDTNLTGLFNMTHPLWSGMRDRKFGRVITISSINGQKGQAGQANYSAAKAGDLGITKALAQEGARAGITVNAICPGYIATEMVKAVPEEVLKAKILPQIPVGRLGEPEEIARCVAFLASDEAGFITGSTLSANGGQYMA